MKVIGKEPVERIKFLDLFRSMGVILMIMGHVGFGEKFDYFIHAFHMPMFFWISGYFFAHKGKDNLTFRQLILKKTKTLLLPYIVFGIAHFIFLIIIQGFTLEPLLRLLTINNDGLPIAGALWFLTALFFSEILFFLIDRGIASVPIKTIIIVMISIWGNVVELFLPFELPYSLGASFVGVGLYYMGYLTRQHQNKSSMIKKILNLSWIQSIGLGLITILLIFRNGYINMRLGNYANIPLFWINAVLSIVVGINISRLLYFVIKDTLVCTWLISISINSIVYVCLNQVEIAILGKVLTYISVPILRKPIFILTATLCALYLSSWIIMNTKLKVLVGKSS